jgi:hypothetical protein
MLKGVIINIITLIILFYNIKWKKKILQVNQQIK